MVKNFKITNVMSMLFDPNVPNHLQPYYKTMIYVASLCRLNMKIIIKINVSFVAKLNVYFYGDRVYLNLLN